ncbi:MAG: PorV/PorQ family protein [Candidatus Krumholzibacteria bacterium]|nr:PorV/PorQ family protein [Candidatus Krumholzibacteria bacterium]
MMKTAAVCALAALLVVLSTAPSLAQGESGAQCLIIQPSARANGLGQSYVAIADDATGIWWNPAGLAFVNRSIDLMHSQLVPELASDVFYEYLGGAGKVKGLGTIGGSLVYLTYGDWEARDQDNNYLGDYSSWEIAPTLSGAVQVLDNLGIGMNLKFVYIDLAPASATVENQAGRGHTVAFDVGGLWKVPDFNVLGYRVSRLNLGLCISNLGPAISFVNVDQAAALPRNFRLGFAYTPYYDEAGRLMVAAEFNKPLVDFSSKNTYHVGAEFVYIDLIAVRTGYVYDAAGNIKDLTYGLGFSFNKRYRLDWASIPQSQDLGRVNRWSLGFTF